MERSITQTRVSVVTGTSVMLMLQIATILAERGDALILRAAHAFGMIESFRFTSTATCVMNTKSTTRSERKTDEGFWILVFGSWIAERVGCKTDRRSNLFHPKSKI